ncbi:MAG TPA: response regulator [Thermoanaerobaculia bacterium]|nr:response regulator [Thermoanaerobaculia bacterium]
MIKRLLVVEDETAILHALELYFRNRGFEVDTATEREEAESLLSRQPYGVVIADLRLGDSEGTEGLEVISAVRRCSPKTRTILLTAYGSTEVELEAKRRGVDVLLHKPQPLSSIASVIDSLLEGS